MYKLGQTGKLGLVPPSELDQPGREGADKSPLTPAGQAADDMERLSKAQAKVANPTGAPADSAGVDTSRPSRPAHDEFRVPSQVGASESKYSASGAVTRAPNDTRAAVIRPGEQENAPPNNLTTDAAGKQVGGAEGERISNEEARRRADEAAASASGTVIK